MKQINQPMWQSEEDGKLFNDEAECLAHEKRVRVDRRIKSYLASKEWGRGKDTAALNVLVEFFKYEEAESEHLDTIKADAAAPGGDIDARNGSKVAK